MQTLVKILKGVFENLSNFADVSSNDDVTKMLDGLRTKKKYDFFVVLSMFLKSSFTTRQEQLLYYFYVSHPNNLVNPINP